jgi:hypothetical protein
MVLYWDQRQYKKTIPWSLRTNTGQFTSAPGATDYRVYAAATDADNQVETYEHVCFQANQDNTHLISDDEDDTGTDDSEQPHEHMPYEPSSQQEPFTQKANAEYNNETREENLLISSHKSQA